MLVIYNEYMLLIVGLGNPDRKYKDTRHNVGFMVLDALADNLGAEFSKSEKFNSEIAETVLTFEGRTGRTRLLLAKPQTYMNRSGDAVSKIINFYKLRPHDQVWVVHDDLDIEIGTLRIRLKGSSAGQKGVQSIIDQLGTDEFARFRIGIGPKNNRTINAENFVLEKFDKTEKPIIDEEIKELVGTIKKAIDKGITADTL
jgi:PTH1 family peptidyl-tRNA hydrolase